MRSRSLVSTSNRALASCPDANAEGDTHVERCIGLHVCKLQRCCHHMLCFEVGDGFDVLVQVHVASAEVPVRHALPARSPTFFAIARHCVWYLMAFA